MRALQGPRKRLVIARLISDIGFPLVLLRRGHRVLGIRVTYEACDQRYQPSHAAIPDHSEHPYATQAFDQRANTLFRVCPACHEDLRID